MYLPVGSGQGPIHICCWQPQELQVVRHLDWRPNESDPGVA